MKILSWNILADEFIEKRYYPMIPPAILLNRAQRQRQIMHLLTQLDMDVLLLQEVMPAEYNTLLQIFQKTHHVLRGKNITWQNKQSHSANVTVLRKTLFTRPVSLPLAFGLGVQCVYQTRSLVLFNIHLDDLSPTQRHAQVTELLPFIASQPRVIVGGDFNENYKASAPSELYQRFQTTVVGLRILNQQPSYYIERKMCIDNILIKGLALKHPQAYVLDAFKGDRVKQFITYGSDHLPIAVN
jgi:endonuclease/exonuclease/phosphatase family metal-dependent hydrolase